ncbi:MAG TPA: SPOR domain-containing protein [Candidatus Thiothrix moscowensis]|uniref:SPOR domain-containing protein n=1 Tax=unclassified Thiothrix TaxID=2636184 RepID=UPI0025FFC08E|nr:MULTISPECIES: SPOR domain-containing protein [unclassified Thiothrix]HRJ52464.1 SPOR domain-containing protein [Candidatus Thiothrix moscowensis]HRJ93350.1 SPOR domain-containing protein [Candidatus Thiothrix moscowensis]
MQNKIKLGVATLTLATFISGCAPMANTADPQAGTVPAGGSYGTTTSYDANTSGSYYDAGVATDGNNNAGGAYSSSYDSYYAGGSSSTGGSNTGGSSSYYDYSSSGSSSYGGGSGGSKGSASGSHAVQVVASPNRSTAEAMASQMRSMGYTAVIDQVGGYYKVRVPYTSASEAKASLNSIRSSVPDAFYTTR